MIRELSFILFIALMVLVLVFSFIDKRKKRKFTKKIPLSFVIPCYNDGATVGATIKSIYDHYEKKLIDLVIVNDKSTDNSRKIIEKLQKKYHFKLVNNEKNLGKSAALNKVTELTKHETIVFIDADTLVNKKSLYDVLARLEHDPRLAAVSCPYKPLNKGFLAIMQGVEYNMLSLIQGSYNLFSAMAMWGGFHVVRKKAFLKAGKYSVNAITEDMDLAYKLNDLKYRVEQSFYRVESEVPDTWWTWMKQKLRWTSGGMQCMINYPKIWLKNPLHLFFVLAYTFMTVVSLMFFFNETIITEAAKYASFILESTEVLLAAKVISVVYGPAIIKELLIKLAFTLLSVVYVIPSIKKLSDLSKILLVVPYSLIYFPIYILVSYFGILVAIWRFKELKKGIRAW